MLSSPSAGLRRPGGQRVVPGPAGAVHPRLLRLRLDSERAAGPGRRAGRPAGGRRRPRRRARAPGRRGWGWPSSVGTCGRGRSGARVGGPPGRWPWSTQALDAATRRTPSAPGFDPAPAWNRWWRLVLAVPVPVPAASAGIRNIDYWGDGIYRHRLDVLIRRADPPAGRRRSWSTSTGGPGSSATSGSRASRCMHELVQRGWVCVAVNYRLSPRATWPDHIVDCKRAMAWVRDHIAEYGGDPRSSPSPAARPAATCPPWSPSPPTARVAARLRGADTSVDACIPFYGVHDMTGDPDAAGSLRPRPRRAAREAGDEGALRRTTRPCSSGPRPTSASRRRRRHVLRRPGGQRHPGAAARWPAGSPSGCRRVSASPVAYLELPRAQHAFDVAGLDPVPAHHPRRGRASSRGSGPGRHRLARTRTGVGRPRTVRARAAERPGAGHAAEFLT